MSHWVSSSEKKRDIFQIIFGFESIWTFGISPNRLNRTVRWIAKTNQIADNTTARASDHVDGEKATEDVEQLKDED